jgi:hypothetical protein
MNNDKKSRQRKERWEGRKFNEKTVFIRRYVRCRLLAAKLRNPLAVCRLVATAIFRNFRNSADGWLENQEGTKMEGVK